MRPHSACSTRGHPPHWVLLHTGAVHCLGRYAWMIMLAFCFLRRALPNRTWAPVCARKSPALRSQWGKNLRD